MNLWKRGLYITGIGILSAFISVLALIWTSFQLRSITWGFIAGLTTLTMTVVPTVVISSKQGVSKGWSVFWHMGGFVIMILLLTLNLGEPFAGSYALLSLLATALVLSFFLT